MQKGKHYQPGGQQLANGQRIYKQLHIYTRTLHMRDVRGTTLAPNHNKRTDNTHARPQETITIYTPATIRRNKLAHQPVPNQSQRELKRNLIIAPAPFSIIPVQHSISIYPSFPIDLERAIRRHFGQWTCGLSKHSRWYTALQSKQLVVVVWNENMTSFLEHSSQIWPLLRQI